MLSGAGLCDDAPFPHALRQQGLSQTIVDLVSTGMVQVFTLQIDSVATKMQRQKFSAKQRRRTTS
jgi:hypothetical protein